MSSISFPHHPHPPSPSSSQTSHGQHQHRRPAFFPTSYDPDTAQSAFQINPLSNHPPRTPNASIISAHTTYLPDIYSNNAREPQEKPPSFEEDSIIKQEDLVSDTGSSANRRGQIKTPEVWKDMLATSTGRDKALKLIQYSMRFYVLLHRTLTGDVSKRFRKQRVQAKWEAELMTRLTSSMAGLSLARKCLILFNWLTPYNSIMQPDSIPFHSSKKLAPKPFFYPFLRASPPVLLDFVNGIAEDISTSAKLGLIRGRLGERAGRLADWTWFAGTLVALVELSMDRSLVRNLMQDVESRLYSETVEFPGTVPSSTGRETDERELEKLKTQLYWIRISRLKLLMDLVFVTFECFRIEKAKESVKTITGLASACLSSAKLYDRHQRSLSKSLSS